MCQANQFTPPADADGGDRKRLTFRFDSSGWFYVYHFGVALWLQLAIALS